jgi:hypothetical protein
MGPSRATILDAGSKSSERPDGGEPFYSVRAIEVVDTNLEVAQRLDRSFSIGSNVVENWAILNELVNLLEI